MTTEQAADPVARRARRDPIARRVREVPASGIRRFFDIINTMDDVISLGVGEPDFTTPLHDVLYGIRHDVVETAWPIAARGKLQ